MRATLFALLATISFTASAQQAVIKVDGSSTVFPVTEAVAEDFMASNKGTRVTVGISGTGGGFKKMCRGEIDIANASRPILEKEIEDCKKAGIRYYEIPVAYDALAVVVNKANPLSQITIPQLKAMWSPEAQQKVMKWKDADQSFPDAKLALFGPGSDSGTFDYFTEAVVGKAKSSRGDYTASEDDNVLVKGVSTDKGALGYFGLAYYVENTNKLKALSVIGKDGKPVAPSEKTVMDNTYPLSRPLFIYVSEKAAQRPEVKQFVEFYLTNATALTKEVKYVPLPPKAYVLGKAHFNTGKIGTVFGGKPEVGLTIEELLRREAK